MKTTLNIQNLKCGGCANTIINRLSKLDGIETVSVNNEDNRVTFSYLNISDVEKAIVLLSKLGYPIESEANPLSKKAKSFVSCAIGRVNN